MEILARGRYDEYEAFCRAHPRGNVMQSVLWHGVKSGWGHEVVVSRGANGAIRGGMSVLIQRIPLLGVALLYAPRGPVCDLSEREVFENLLAGAREVARLNRGYAFRIDPDILIGDAFSALAGQLGFRVFLGGDGFETIQPRFNYRIYLDGRDEDALLANMTQQTRRNVRIAQKRGVEVHVRGAEALDEFMPLMAATGARDGFTVRGRGYFEQLLGALGEHCRLYMAYHEGQPLAGAITTNYAGKCCYLYGASGNEHRNLMPTYLVQWEMLRWAAQTGCSVYDFQGVSGNLTEEGNPLYGLYRFKKGFGGTLDEGAGEFDFVYMPLRARLAGLIISLNERRIVLRRKLRERLRGGKR